MRVHFTHQRHAASLAHALDGLDGLAVYRHAAGCEIEVDGVNSGRAIVAVLEAIRDTLADEPASSASVLLDGREYRMQGRNCNRCRPTTDLCSTGEAPRGHRRQEERSLEASGGLVSDAKALELAAAVKSANDRKPE